METVVKSLTRADFRERYKCSNNTFKKWLKNSNIAAKIPDIGKKRLFPPNEAQIIIETFG